MTGQNVTPEFLRGLADSPRGVGKNNALRVAADTIDALRADAKAWDEIRALIRDQRDAARAEVARLRKENAALRAGDDAVSIAGKVALMKARAALGEETT